MNTKDRIVCVAIMMIAFVFVSAFTIRIASTDVVSDNNRSVVSESSAQKELVKFAKTAHVVLDSEFPAVAKRTPHVEKDLSIEIPVEEDDPATEVGELPAETEVDELQAETEEYPLQQEEETIYYSEFSHNVEILACQIYSEVGANDCSDETRYMCGDVILNRVLDPRFGDTIEEVLMEKGQWGRNYWTGIVWPDRASDPKEQHAVERAYRIAEDLLNGNHSYIYNTNYIWFAEFKQGHDIIYQDGCYFGRG